METFGVFDGGEGGDGARGQFVQSSANRSAVVSATPTQPRGPRPAAQNAYRAPNPDNQQKQLVPRGEMGDRSLLGANASANFETYHDTIATRARVWAGQGPDPFSKSGKKETGVRNTFFILTLSGQIRKICSNSISSLNLKFVNIKMSIQLKPS